MSLEDDMKGYYDDVEREINGAFSTLGRYEQKARGSLDGSSSDHSWMKELLDKLGSFAGQGVYLLDEYGTIDHYEIEGGLRNTRGNHGNHHFKWWYDVNPYKGFWNEINWCSFHGYAKLESSTWTASYGL